MAFGGLIYGVYMFFGTGKPNVSSIFKPEVELKVFLRMRSNKITKNTENAIKMELYRVFMFFRRGKSESEVHF